MKIKESKELMSIALTVGKTAKEVSEIIISGLIEKELIEDIQDIYGCTVRESWNGSFGVSCFTDILNNLGLPMDPTFILKIGALQLFGDFDCLECGGKMEETDQDIEHVSGDGLEYELEYKINSIEKTCCACGHVENEPGE